MRTVTIEYKDIKNSKITVAKDEIRIKINSNLIWIEQMDDLSVLKEYAEYFQDKEYPVTARFTLEKINLRLTSDKNALGFEKSYLSYQAIKRSI